MSAARAPSSFRDPSGHVSFKDGVIYRQINLPYKEDYDLIEESFCDCGCKSAIYVKEEWTGDEYDTEFITQKEYEKIPNKPKPTPEQTKLQTDIIRADREEEKLGIIHGQRSCSVTPVPKLECRIPEEYK